MKRIFLSLMMVLALVGAASAQVRAQSEDVQFKDGALSIQYINDGLKGSAGIRLNDIGFNNVGGVKNLALNALVVNPRTNASENSYLGAFLSYTHAVNSRLAFNVGVGVKGVDITSLLTDGGFGGFNTNASRQFIWGVGVSFKL